MGPAPLIVRIAQGNEADGGRHDIDAAIAGGREAAICLAASARVSGLALRWT